MRCHFIFFALQSKVWEKREKEIKKKKRSEDFFVFLVSFMQFHSIFSRLIPTTPRKGRLSLSPSLCRSNQKHGSNNECLSSKNKEASHSIKISSFPFYCALFPEKIGILYSRHRLNIYLNSPKWQLLYVFCMKSIQCPLSLFISNQQKNTLHILGLQELIWVLNCNHSMSTETESV